MMMFETIRQSDALSDAAPGPTRVVVCGEASSGKSTVINALMRDLILPDNLGVPTRPSVTVRWRSAAGIEFSSADGAWQTVERIEKLDTLRGAERIEIWSNRRHMKHFEVIELPLTTAEDLTEDQREMVRSADLMIWVTIASQAWRLTERKILDELVDVRPRRTILAVSRADKLRCDADREKLIDRITRETAEYFDAICPVHGARQDLRRASRSSEAFHRTGGASLFSCIVDFRREFLAQIQDSAADDTVAVTAGALPARGASRIHPVAARSKTVQPQLPFGDSSCAA